MPPDHSDLPPRMPALSLAPLERTVVALGLRDPLWSVHQPARWFRGNQRHAERLQLANPRLEKLRRFIVSLRHGCAASDGFDVPALLAAGFSSDQISEAQMMTRLHSSA